MAYIFLLSTLFFLPTTLAHMQITSPSPFRDPHANRVNEPKDYDILNPLHSDGSNFACKGYHLNTPWTSVATYEAGGTYSMTLSGSATHSGGSCQISFSCDGGENFKVVKSIIGGCPLQKEYDFTVPVEFGNVGGATCLFAWTWFNKIGNREMYMNCAVVDIVPPGSRTRRGTRPNLAIRDTAKINAVAQTALSSYPDLFVANLASINNCVAPEALDVVFDDPGSTVSYGDSAAALREPSFNRGACRGKSQKTSSTSSSSSSSSSSGSSSSQQSSTLTSAINPNDGQWHPELWGRNQQPSMEQWYPDTHGKRKENRQKRRALSQTSTEVNTAIDVSSESNLTSEPATSSNDSSAETPALDVNLLAFLEKLNTLSQSIFTLVKYNGLWLDRAPAYDRRVIAGSDAFKTIPSKVTTIINTLPANAYANAQAQLLQLVNSQIAQLQQYWNVTVTELEQTIDRQPIERRQLVPLTSADLIKPINVSSTTPSFSIPTSESSITDILLFFFAVLTNNIANNMINNTTNNISPVVPPPTSPLFPYFLGPGPFLPQNITVGPTSDNLENMPPLTNDLGPEDEDSVREFFANLGKEDRNTTETKVRRDQHVARALDPNILCPYARQVLVQMIEQYRAKLVESCELGPGAEMPDVMNQVCAINQQTLNMAISLLENVVRADCKLVLVFLGWA